jgi:hypothetical protein
LSNVRICEAVVHEKCMVEDNEHTSALTGIQISASGKREPGLAPEESLKFRLCVQVEQAWSMPE